MEEYSRRSFLSACGKLISAAALTTVITPLVVGCEPTSLPLVPIQPQLTPGPDGAYAISVSDLSDSNPVKLLSGLNGPDNLPILVTRVGPGDFRALSSQCTHQNCEVQGTLQSGAIPCLCHGSLFNLDGTVKQGPATTPLKKYNSTYDAGSSTIHIKLI